MAKEIISIIGEGGYASLFARSAFLTQSVFPWIVCDAMFPQTDDRFAELRSCFAKQAPAQIVAANCLLLVTFTDILASLIGEELTNRILRSAWGDDPSDAADKGVPQ